MVKRETPPTANGGDVHDGRGIQQRLRLSLTVTAFLFAAALAVWGTAEFQSPSADTATTAPQLASLTPTAAKIGDTITLKGSGFTATENDVLFLAAGRTGEGSGGFGTYAVSGSSGTIVVPVPEHLSPKCEIVPNDQGQRCQVGLQPGTNTLSGSYAVKVKNAHGTSNALPFTVGTAPETVVTLTSSAASYQAGSDVVFTLTNKGPGGVTLPNGAPFVVKQGSTTVFTPLATQALVTLAANESKSWSWNQRDNQNQQVVAGAYSVELQYRVGALEKQVATTVTITGTPASNAAKPALFSANRTSGEAPLQVSLGCTLTEADFSVDFGDGVRAEGVTCPVMLTHTYTVAGVYSIGVKQGDTERSKQTITVSGATTTNSKGDGKGTPTKLGRTGASLALTLAVAALLSALASWRIMAHQPKNG